MANIGNENDQQTWMKNINEPIHNQNHNKGKHNEISMKCMECKHNMMFQTFSQLWTHKPHHLCNNAYHRYFYVMLMVLWMLKFIGQHTS